MLNNLYLFILPLILITVYISVKYFLHRFELAKVNAVSDEDVKMFDNNFDEAKEMVFGFFDNLQDSLVKLFTTFFHWFLHFFVIFLKLISDGTDVLYAKNRDFFLKTATKEKETVATFWHHLKEYKKEKEEEKKEEEK